jgi:serine/threonine protein phosphatase PrpC
VSNVVGSEDAHIEIGPRRQLSPRDTLLIASDGLFDNLHTEEIVELIRKGPLAQAAQNLATSVECRMDGSDEEHPCKPDDLTYVLFRGS